MNIGRFFSDRPRTVSIFTWLWLVGSVIASCYFAFWVFPKIVDPVVEMYFLTRSGADYVYWPNSETYRKQYLGQLADTYYLYYSKCAALPPSQAQNCDPQKNWRKIDPKKLNCKDVAGCIQETYIILKDEQADVLRQINSIDGHPIQAKDPNAVSFSDPAGWGDAGKWPVFFVTIFLAVRLGRAVGEFAFAPYTKE